MRRILLAVAGLLTMTWLLGGDTVHADTYIGTGGAGDSCAQGLIQTKIDRGTINPATDKIIPNCYSASMGPFIGSDSTQVSTDEGAQNLARLMAGNCPPTVHCTVEGFSLGALVVAKGGAAAWGPGNPAPSNIDVITDGNAYAGTPGDGPGLVNSPLAPYFMPPAIGFGIPAPQDEPQIPKSTNRTDANDFFGYGGANKPINLPAAVAQVSTRDNNHNIPDQRLSHDTYVDGNNVTEEIYNAGTDPFAQASTGNPAQVGTAQAPSGDLAAAPPPPGSQHAAPGTQLLSPEQQYNTGPFPVSPPGISIPGLPAPQLPPLPSPPGLDFLNPTGPPPGPPPGGGEQE
jgi:hypothetical protein